MGTYDGYSDMQIDVLKEIGNIGSGNACTALAMLLNTFVDMSVPSVRLLDLDSVKEFLGGEESEVLGIKIGVKEDLTGMMMHIVKKPFAEKIINTFYPKELATLADLGDMDLSVLSEMGNITSGAYANALASLSGMKVDIMTPQYHVSTVGDILKIPFDECASVGDKILVIDEQFIMGEEKMTSHMLLILDAPSLNKLFTRLGITS
ncbi:MAG: chemotaxis protein CheC [Lachnospiraceae bacterium]|nr:chemotaxis protein CheC [Lachnospiraceae bacterium]MBR6486001.1 chemotaxis protein CheC [Lachnospiraceae bacterium]